MKSGGTFWAPVLYTNILNVGIYMAAFYLLSFYQLPQLYNKGKYAAFARSLLLCAVGFYTLWRGIGYLTVGRWYFPSVNGPFFSPATFMTQTIQFYSPAVLLLAWETYHESVQEKLRSEQLEKEKLANELKYLKAQINPHFLFNSLNNLYSFVLNQSPKAPELIMRLSAMLDYILYKSQKPTVALQEEITCIEDYVELEKIRYGDRLNVDMNTTGDLNAPVAPLLFLSVVENAFKHGASGDTGQPEIKISIGNSTDKVTCCVWNTKSALPGELNDAYKEGIGLSNIKRQLQLTYPKQHQIKVREGEKDFEVIIDILKL